MLHNSINNLQNTPNNFGLCANVNDSDRPEIDKYRALKGSLFERCALLIVSLLAVRSYMHLNNPDFKSVKLHLFKCL